MIKKKRYFLGRGDNSLWADDDLLVQQQDERDDRFEIICGQINDLMKELDCETRLIVCFDIIDHVSLMHGERGKKARSLLDDIRGLIYE